MNRVFDSFIQLRWPVVALLLTAIQSAAPPEAWSAEVEPPEGFQAIFNGRDLEGWDGNPEFWRVEDGTITGQTTADKPTRGNTFLIWREGEVGDFELRIKFRIEGGNSGIQYRSKEANKWVIGGYQADIDATNTFTGILYEERGRNILAQRGQRVLIKPSGEKEILGTTATNEEILAAVKQGQWNDYTVVAEGNKLRHVINGKVTMELTDEEEAKRAMSGLLALQLHAGDPMKIQFKDVFLKRLGNEQSKATGADPVTKKIVFVAGRPSHGYGAHEHHAGCLLLAKYVQQALPGYRCEVVRDGWPADGLAAFEGADAVVVYCDGGGGHLLNPHLDEFAKVMDRGAGLVCLHYAVEVPKGKPGQSLLDWIGGYFETDWSVNPHWTAEFEQLPDHPIARGVEPFAINDEWYFHMRFREGLRGVTPILSAVAPAETMSRTDGTHSGNPAVRASVARGDQQHVAWAAERPNGGRGFGFTGGHFHWNWGDDNFRKVVLNAIVWTAHGEVPEHGVSTDTPTREALEANQDEPKPEDRRGASHELAPAATSRAGQPAPGAPTVTQTGTRTRYVAELTGDHDAAKAVANLDVHPELEVTLLAAEPMLLSPSTIDVDHRGRVWVCEVVNYRGHNGRRPEGDRILILEDTDNNGQIDSQKVYYQGQDVNSAHGICVLGNKVIVSCGAKVMCFTDNDGDDHPDSQEDWFTKIGGVQHDHGIHAFVFGPDGKLYFNHGNEGHKELCDAAGRPIVDAAGNVVRTDRKPYQEGMVFRCNLDLTGFETLGWNFRNNWMVTVDSFGTLWQSDNDDDGNRGVRINNVVEFGNYGYRDELTGAFWQTPRTGMEEEIPLRHWHLNDPGVVPNLLLTGAGSPTGITVYEGDLLPEVFQNQLIHCDAGPSVTRCYRVRQEGAGYAAEIVNLLEGGRDNWFRPSDVKVAPDGSLIVADWYDPGVGGHAMGDLDRGRLFRITPKGGGAKFTMPKFDFSTAEGAIAALKNPNYAVRYLAWQSLHGMGTKAEPALRKVWEDDANPRFRARALWLLGKIPGRGPTYVDAALASDQAMLRIVGLRLARQLPEVGALHAVQKLVTDSDPLVRRECAVALRFDDRPEAIAAWTKVAVQYNAPDRWYLEALGIGADLKWDACLSQWLHAVGPAWNEPAGRDVVWRSRASQTPERLAQLILDPRTPTSELPRYFRAFDFLQGPEREQVLWQIALHAGADADRQRMMTAESLSRVRIDNAAQIEQHRDVIARLVRQLEGSDAFIELVVRFGLANEYPKLVSMVTQSDNRELAVRAATILLEKDRQDLLQQALADGDLAARTAVLMALGDTSDNRAVPMLIDVVESAAVAMEERRMAVRSLAKLRRGADWLVRAARRDTLTPDLRDVTAASLQTIPWRDLRRQVENLFPSPPSKGDKPLPSLAELDERRGDAARGSIVFRESGTCAKCHIVRDQGQEIGPNLTEIGDKLSRQAMYESILFPSAGISHNYETYALTTRDGNVLTGLLMGQTDSQLTIKNNEGLSRTVARADVDELQKQSVSLMPADLYKLLTEQDLVDVIEYLQTLRK